MQLFDAGRGVAAIVVLITHAFYVFLSRFSGYELILLWLSIAAEYAVYFFFFMSGFLITLSMMNNVARNGQFDLVEYASSRIARIYPPLIGAILIVVAIDLLVSVFDLPNDLGLAGRSRYEFEYSEIATAITMRGGLGIPDGPLWSLFVEWKIYMIAGFVWSAIWMKNIFIRIASPQEWRVLFPFFAILALRI